MTIYIEPILFNNELFFPVCFLVYRRHKSFKFVDFFFVILIVLSEHIHNRAFYLFEIGIMEFPIIIYFNVITYIPHSNGQYMKKKEYFFSFLISFKLGEFSESEQNDLPSIKNVYKVLLQIWSSENIFNFQIATILFCFVCIVWFHWIFCKRHGQYNVMFCKKSQMQLFSVLTLLKVNESNT